MPSDHRAFHVLLARAPSRYHHLAAIARDGWAWEFLRRNSRYGDAWSALAPSSHHWSLYAYVDPTRSADVAATLWTEVSRYTLAVTSAPADRHHANAFDLRDARCDVHTFTLDDMHQHILILDEGHRLQLEVTGRPVSGRVLLSPVAGQTNASPTRCHELRRALDHFVLHGRLPERLYRGETGAHRLLFILLALDGARESMPVQDLARLLFGPARLQQGGRRHGRALRAQIYRAISRGEWLVREGYRSLLI